MNMQENGKEVEIKPREIEIYDIELISIYKEKKEIVYRVKCSKGTYIRTLCEDIAKKIGTVGFMKELNRTRVGEFDISQAIKISEIINCENLDMLEFISIEKFFENEKSIILNENKITKFLNGVRIFQDLYNGIYRIYNQNKNFIGIGIVENGRLKRDIVI